MDRRADQAWGILCKDKRRRIPSEEEEACLSWGRSISPNQVRRCAALQMPRQKRARSNAPTSSPARQDRPALRAIALAVTGAQLGVEVHQLHLAVCVGLLEDLLQMATHRVIRNVKQLGDARDRMP